ncbi:MAG: hypothetical protein ABI723_22125 [Bacteroidia bacterium]
MRLFYFNFDKVVPQHRDVHTLIPSIIFSREPVVYSTEGGRATDYLEPGVFDKYPKIMFQFYKSFYSLSLGEAAVNDVVMNLEKGYKMERKKMRTSQEQGAVVAYKRLFNIIRNMVYDYIKWSLESNYLDKLNIYQRAGCIMNSNIMFNKDNGESTGENNVGAFAHILKEPFEYIVMTEAALAYMAVYESNHQPPGELFKENGIIRVGRFDLPGCVMLKHSKLKLLCEELQPPLSAWQDVVNRLQEEIKEITWSADDLTVIYEKINAQYLPVHGSLQSAIAESIYFNQLAHGEWGDYDGSLMLFACSRRALIRVLRDTRQLTDITFPALDEYFTGNNLIDKPVLFFVHSVSHFPEQDDKIKNEEVRPRWEASFQ